MQLDSRKYISGKSGAIQLSLLSEECFLILGYNSCLVEKSGALCITIIQKKAYRK
jgi:hypothetical protein